MFSVSCWVMGRNGLYVSTVSLLCWTVFGSHNAGPKRGTSWYAMQGQIPYSEYCCPIWYNYERDNTRNGGSICIFGLSYDSSLCSLYHRQFEWLWTGDCSLIRSTGRLWRNLNCVLSIFLQILPLLFLKNLKKDLLQQHLLLRMETWASHYLMLWFVACSPLSFPLILTFCFKRLMICKILGNKIFGNI